MSITQTIVVFLGGPMLYRVVTDAAAAVGGSSNDSGHTSDEDEAKNEANLQQVHFLRKHNRTPGFIQCTN